jgi:hypothetical protein
MGVVRLRFLQHRIRAAQRALGQFDTTDLMDDEIAQCLALSEVLTQMAFPQPRGSGTASGAIQASYRHARSSPNIYASALPWVRRVLDH